jgi:hypothetical protein
MEEHVEPKIRDQERNVTTEHTGEGENTNLSLVFLSTIRLIMIQANFALQKSP